MPRVRLVRRQVYLAETQQDWLERCAEEIGISWQEFLRGIVQAAKDADERRQRWRHPPDADPAAE